MNTKKKKKIKPNVLGIVADMQLSSLSKTRIDCILLCLFCTFDEKKKTGNNIAICYLRVTIVALCRPILRANDIIIMYIGP